jgi:glycosyltransferase involved in cell wall biosynthesis
MRGGWIDVMMIPESPRSLSVVLPCFNEEQNVEAAAQDAERAARGLFDDFEIIIVDDGSRDGTAAIVDGLASANSRIRVIRHPQNRGYGAALKSGFARCSGDLIFFTDADRQFDLRELGRLVPLIEKCDIAAGYRLNRRDPLLRRMNGFLWTKATALLLGFTMRDVNCAFKLFRRDVFTKLKLGSDGALINAEILARARKKGFVVREIGVHHYQRSAGRPTGGRTKVILRALRDLVKLRIELSKGRCDA